VSTAINSRAEALKLARLLGLDGPESLTYTQQAPASELLDYRNAVTELLYDDDRALLQRMADAASLLPVHTLATVAERALGAPICARLTGLLDPDLAEEISWELSIDFLAEVAAELDPRRAIDVVRSLPPDRTLEIAVAMAAHGEHVAMGRFVAHLGYARLAACVETLADEDLLRIAFVLEGKERLEELFDLVGLERAQCMLDGAESIGLGEEALDLLDQLNARQRKQLLEHSRG
jgi:hypothetical protein